MNQQIIGTIASTEGALVLCTVMQVKGSAPRHAGSMMLSGPEGLLAGSVGGGRGEAELAAAYGCPLPSERLGSMRANLGFDGGSWGGDYAPPPYATAADTAIYSPKTAAQFDFPTTPALPPQSLHFARKICALAKDRGTKLAVLALPQTETWQSKLIPMHWPAALRSQAVLLGMPPAALFHGIGHDDMLRLFFDSGHLNSNGQKLFTPLVCPRLLEVYERAL